MKDINKASAAFLVMGGLIGLWVTAALVSALSQSNWQVSQLIGNYLVAIGVIKEFNTLVDFYTHIKGIEYLICVAFFVAFPMFFKYLNKPATIKT
jgi:hypothetical protein